MIRKRFLAAMVILNNQVEKVTCNVGWQPIPSNWLVKKGYMAVFLTKTLDLRLFSVTKRSDHSPIRFFCHLCSRTTCSHIKEEILKEQENALLDNYRFDMDNDMDDELDEDLSDLVSKKEYPRKPTLFSH
jgi:hypothetical protein